MPSDVDNPDPGARVFRGCRQEWVIGTLVEGQRRQNGSIDNINRNLTRLLERIPEDLSKRLSDVEKAIANREGATGMARWIVGLLGFSGGATVATLLFREGGPLHTLWRTVLGGG